jgi:predicted hydrocarbon binding protein
MKRDKKDKISVYMPSEAIKSLRLELSNLLGEKLASGVLFRFGYRCGEALIEEAVTDNPKNMEIESALPKIWKQTNLGKITKIEEKTEDELEIEQEDSIEANLEGTSDSPSCDYTRGYLAGITSALTKKKFYCVETACISGGNKKCTFHLIVFPHRVLVPKKGS